MNKLARATSTYDSWKTTEPEWMDMPPDEAEYARERWRRYLEEKERQEKEERK